ncbi:hypothetical protein FRB94_010508 [Tulasnella sp. JGI-2019a]|nr:hypothetical protein FRB93_008391 [Tulasnella sp. JGI-2019a]KAG8993640.1 hypothetical protein FRB94_010508 [Tulasnella sp. JGI-2019a]KAG9027986.1 hypothetical protein FRB95_006992 [Tulasnella sp. JGI-2019a]
MTVAGKGGWVLRRYTRRFRGYLPGMARGIDFDVQPPLRSWARPYLNLDLGGGQDTARMYNAALSQPRPRPPAEGGTTSAHRRHSFVSTSTPGGGRESKSGGATRPYIDLDLR